MDKVKKERTQFRRLFTKACNEFENEEFELAVEEKVVKLRVIEEKARQLMTVEEQARELIFDAEADEEVIGREMDESEVYFDRWRILSNKLEKLKDRNSEDNVSVSSSVLPRIHLKYPKLKLPTFNGNVRSWLGFWGQFQKIDQDSNLDNHDKFAYLSQAMEKGTEADELVKSFPPGGASYEKCVKQLKSRFGRDELLIEVYVRDLLSLVLQKHTTKRNSLRKLYDQLETKLRSLETLGVAREKYASMLFPLVESSLPDDTLRAWERFRSAHRRSQMNEGEQDQQETKSSICKTDLDSLLGFVQDEVEAEERISMAVKGFDSTSSSVSTNIKREKSSGKFRDELCIPTAADLLTSVQEDNVCIFCSGHHRSNECIKARKMTLSVKQAAVEGSRCCFLCLKPNHQARNCKSKTGCGLCGKRHNLLLCRNLSKRQSHTKKDDTVESLPKQSEALANVSGVPSVMLQTLTVTVIGKGVKRDVRAIIDSASQCSYILRSTAEEMRYESTRKEYLQHSLFGGSNTGICDHDVFKVYLSSVCSDYRCNFDVLSQSVICGSMPPVARGPWLHELSQYDIRLTDKHEGPIEILIGADVAGKLMTGGYKMLSSGLSAIETKLGWTVMGRNPENTVHGSATLCVMSMLNNDTCITDLWTLDSLGITDISERKTRLELHEAAKQHFLSTVKVEDERFVVHLPWIEDHPPLPNNYEIALKRLDSTVRKLERDGVYQDYEEVFKEWLKEGIIEEVPSHEIEAPCHYLPHRHVIKENSTTKIRPVFDASAKQKGFPSLNECLEKGINLIELIPNIIHRFRQEKIGVVADIRKAFLQIGLFPNDKDFLRFLWNGSDVNLKHYRHCRVVFGVSSSPFLLGAVIQHHLQLVLKEKNDMYPTHIVDKLLRSFYVDNCVTSVQDESELLSFIKVATDVMAKRKFELRGWEYTDSTLSSTITSNVLGMLWDRRKDTLQVNVENIKDSCFEKITKRIILATAHKIFDPLGIACPVGLVPKILLQRTWKKKINWDEEVDTETRNEFMKWLNTMPYLSYVEIPRLIRSGDSKESCSLHIFCDASRLAYAAVAFLRVETKDCVKVQLVQAKTRVSPCGKKETTIARLELLGATIAARLAYSIISEFRVEEVYFWTDSTTVLAWLTREESWGIFVHNRVQEIKSLTSTETWRFVPGTANPADLPSRGCSARQLCKLKWWEGPSWLYLSKEQWPKTENTCDEDVVCSERKKKIVSSLINVGVGPLLGTKFSKYEKTLKVVAWIKRFVYNCRNKEKKSGDLSVSELEVAEKLIVRSIQEEVFEGTTDKRLRSLNTFYDDGIIRLKTGVFRRDDNIEFRTPAVLPGEHPIVRSLVQEEHERQGHVGVSHVLNSLREKFWLLTGRRIVRSVLRTCVICKRCLGKCVNPPTAPPPADRVQDAAVFQVTGIDFAGPVMLRDMNKAWICLFTCGVYRAVHLELVTSMSTETFLQALHRFVSRRGKPSIIYSDNGTNFTGAANVLALIDLDIVSREASKERIIWKFIPPGAPWWGGWWERLIGMMKQILRKILGRASLNYEEMLTILCNCEAILNDRPLTTVTSDPDVTALTPANFLKDIKSDRIPDIHLTVDSSLLRRRLRYIQTVREAFRKRFRQEYLGLLKTKQSLNKISSVNVGDIVLVGADDKKRLEWPLGRIVELLPGADGISRRAKVKTKKGVLVRALQSLYPLEVSTSAELKPEPHDTNQESLPHALACQQFIKTRRGRLVKPPQRMDL